MHVKNCTSLQSHVEADWCHSLPSHLSWMSQGRGFLPDPVQFKSNKCWKKKRIMQKTGFEHSSPFVRHANRKWKHCNHKEQKLMLKMNLRQQINYKRFSGEESAIWLGRERRTNSQQNKMLPLNTKEPDVIFGQDVWLFLKRKYMTHVAGL